MLAAWRAILIALLAMACLAPLASAHPDDEYCDGLTGQDLVICRALARADSGDAPVTEEIPDLEDLGILASPLETGRVFLGLGLRHILPTGTDHILFIIAIAIGAASLRALLLQVSAFTLAHTAALGMAAAGLVSVPEAIVGPLIAASIAFVAAENIFLRGGGARRVGVVFFFGLFHGLGFAGTFVDAGLPLSRFWPGLVGFNIGVEIGQLIVVLTTLGLLAMARDGLRLAGLEPHQRRIIVWPTSAAIALTGLVWTVSLVIT